MSANLEIEYRGYIVAFSENREVWWCAALDVEGEKISTVKTKIDRIIAQARKLANPVAMIHIDQWNGHKPVQVLSLAQPRRDRQGNEEEPSEAWCMVTGNERYYSTAEGKNLYRETNERKKRKLSELYLDTPETHEAIAEIDRLKAEVKQIEERIKAVRTSMPSAAGHFHVEVEETDNG